MGKGPTVSSKDGIAIERMVHRNILHVQGNKSEANISESTRVVSVVDHLQGSLEMFSHPHCSGSIVLNFSFRLHAKSQRNKYRRRLH